MNENRLQVSWFEPGKLEHESILKGLLHTRQYARGVLLDVGCWKKPYAHLFHPYVTRYIGVDLPSVGPAETSPDVYADGCWLPFRDQCIDTVLCTQVLDDVPDPKALLCSFQRVLKRGGFLLLTAPFIWRIHSAPHDYYRFTEYGLRYLAHESGFHVELVEPRGGAWITIGQILSLQMWSLFGRGKLGQWAVRLPSALVQRTAALLDHYHHIRNMTLGYTMVARKT